MKIIFKCFLLHFILLISSSLYTQVGIGTTTPNTSSVLDVFSTSKGLLMPRLSTAQRGLIVSPATGLMIYNTTSNDGQLNIGTPEVPNWIGLKRSKTPIYTVTEGGDVSTTSNDNLLVIGMKEVPSPGTYIALFNAQAFGSMNTTQPFSSTQGVIDMDFIYQSLKVVPSDKTHALVFGNGETLFPGVYDVTGSISIAGTLTLDGNGDSNSMFIIRGTGAFNTGDGATVNLINGASSNNIFWMSEVAMTTTANTVLKGNLVSPAGAITLGTNTRLEGRIFTKAGALSLEGGCILTAPTGNSPIDFGVLSTFVMFTSSGAVSDTATSTIIGDVGTGVGALIIIGAHTGVKYPAGTVAEDGLTTTSITAATYSIYLNGVEVPNSSRTIKLESSIVSLKAMVTVIADNNPIEIRWKVDDGVATLKNRTLSLIRSGY